jgi:hypothetical protein
MSKPDITLQPSKGIISEAAARIYAGYVAAGRVKDEDAETWIKRSIREAIVIAKTVDASIESHDMIAIDESIIVRRNPGAAHPERAQEKSRTTKEAKPRKKEETIEQLAEEVLLDETARNKMVQFGLDEESGEPAITDSPGDATARGTRKLELKEDSDAVTEEGIKRMYKTSSSIPAKPRDAS